MRLRTSLFQFGNFHLVGQVLSSLIIRIADIRIEKLLLLNVLHTLSAPSLMSSKFLSLPAEILVDVLFRLPFQDLMACSMACRRLRALVSDTPLLQYVAYAHRAGVTDRFPPGLTVPDRFAALRRWEAAWSSLDAMAPSGGRVVLHKRPHMKTTCMLRDGFLVAACFKDEPADEELAGYAAIDLQGRSVESAGDGWAETQFEEDVVALDVSVAQNLVAMLHVCVVDSSEPLFVGLTLKPRQEGTRWAERAPVGPFSI